MSTAGLVVSFIAPRAAITHLIDCPIAGIQYGLPTPLDSDVDRLDSPLGVESVREGLEFVAAFAASASAISLLVRAAWRRVRDTTEDFTVVDSDGVTIVVITATSDLDTTVADVIRGVKGGGPNGGSGAT